MIRVLALDLGTLTGWATNCRGAIEVGTWKLATAKEVKAWGKVRLTRRQDPRVLRLQNEILNYCGDVDAIVYEDVEFIKYQKQAQLWASLRAAVWLTCRDVKIRECVGVTVLKKFATGHGGATKEMMMGACARHYPDRLTFDGKLLFDKHTNEALDDNAADAILLARWAIQNLSRIKI